MKPSFALNLSHDGIGLLHRRPGGWEMVGSVPLDAPDLAGDMAKLRAMALDLEPQGLATKLILPASQVLYTTVTVPDAAQGDPTDAIAAALEERTPYEVSELVFDWTGPGPELQVAVVARETLEEAEHFATEHRFAPVSFVTVPDAGQFEGEPFFGATGAAAEILSGGAPDREAEAEAVAVPAAVPSVPPPETAPAPDAGAVPDVTDPTVRDDGPMTGAPESGAGPAPAAERDAVTFASRRSAVTEVLGADSETAASIEAASLAARLSLKPPAMPGTQPPARAAAGARRPKLPRVAKLGRIKGSGAGRVIPAPPPIEPPRSEAEAMTLFGARGARHRAAPILGIAATILLLAALAAAAFWSSDRSAEAPPASHAPDRVKAAAVAPAPPSPSAPASTAEPTIASAEPAPSAAGAPSTVAKPSSAPAALPAEPEPSTSPTVASAETAPSPDAMARAEPEPALPAAAAPAGMAGGTLRPLAQMAGARPEAGAPRALPQTADLPVAGSAAPSIGAALSPDQPSEIALAAIDPAMARDPGPGLASLAAFRPDAAPRSPGPPPDLSQATEPAASPEPAAPAASAPAAAAPAADATQTASAQPNPPPRADPALAGVRPKLRPGTTAGQPPAPLPAPGSAAPLDTPRPQIHPTTGVFAPGAPEPPAISQFAVAASPRPESRPSGLSRGVDAAVASAVASAAAPDTPEVSDSEPEPRSMPRLPANPSIAKQATIKRAINLNRINLLGVFGTSASRSALVRMPGGRVQTVKVGDRLDGGQVAAIGENTLYYVKGGRNIQLTVPQS